MSLDELAGIGDYAQFTKGGGVEYDPTTDVGKGTSFWNGISNKEANARRVQKAEQLFEKNYPGSKRNIQDAPCDFDFKKFYQTQDDYEAMSANTAANPPGCHTAAPGEECYQQVSWAMSDGIHAHPDWYPGLSPVNTFVDFQKHMAQGGNSACKIPCGAVVNAAPSMSPYRPTAAPTLPPYRPATANTNQAQPIMAPTPAPLSQQGPPPVGGCQSLRIGDPCWRDVIFAMTTGIHSHPEWYPGLTQTSPMNDFQSTIAVAKPNVCRPPC